VEPSSAPWRVLEAPETDDADPPPDRASRERPLLAMAVAAIVVVAAIALVAATSGDPAVDIAGGTGLADVTGIAGDPGGGSGMAVARSAPPAVPIIVEVGGAVTSPGVYRLPPDARVGDAITAAGGFGPRVDAALADRQLNLAAIVHDGDEIHVPARGDPAAPGPDGATTGSPASGGGGAAAAIDLNRASAEALDTLPGVGPATAAKIIAAREEQPFASVDDLGTRKVVGPSTLEKIRPLVVVGP
jgi:competence protein ComEA